MKVCPLTTGKKQGHLCNADFLGNVKFQVLTANKNKKRILLFAAFACKSGQKHTDCIRNVLE